MLVSSAAFAQFGTPVTPSVSPSGAFSLEVPIRIAPGTTGVAPKLSLVYSSQSGNGIAGVGWNLSGLSTIMRCPKTLAVDGERGGVNLNSNDRLCLDGQRLILQSGTYGSPGAIYYTELFGGSRVVQVNDQLVRFPRRPPYSPAVLSYTGGSSEMAHAASANITARITSGSGNVAFRVQSKAGEVLEYAAADLDDFQVTRMWLLVRVVDVKGNYWSVDYYRDAINGEYRPATIQYTGHSSPPISAPYNRIDFYYAPRPDPTVAFIGGVRVSNTQRLTNIKTVSDGTEVTDYRLTYAAPSGTTFRSLLASIQECTPASGCQQPVGFSYSGTVLQDFIWGNWQGHPGLYWDNQRQTYVNNYVGDFDGDGKSDQAAYAGNGNWHIALSTGSNFVNQPYYWQGPGSDIRKHAGDFNGDGKTDIAAFTNQGDLWHIALSTGSSFDNRIWTCHSGGDENTLSGDFNGDGRTDLAIHSSNGTWHMCLSNGNGFDIQFWPNGHGGDRATTLVGDFNGDGMTDLAAFDLNSQQWNMCLSTGNGWSCSLWPGHGERYAAKNFLGDFNGDGKTDTMAFDLGTRQWNMCLSTGTGFNCSLWAGVGDADNQILGDFNGDGRTDAAAYTGSGGIWNVCYSAGDHFNCTYQTITGDRTVNAFVGDYNGDGLADIAAYTGANGIWEVRLSNPGGYPDLLSSLQSSQSEGVGPTGVQTTVTYAPLSATDRYQKEINATYPQAVVSSPLYVVTSLASDNAVGSTNRVDYWYGTALADHTGRGLLGFNWQESLDQQSGIVSRITFRQDWPFIGLPNLQQTWRPGKSQLLRRTNTTWLAKTLTTQEPLTATSCVDGAQAGRPVLLNSAPFDQSWDIDAAATALPTTTTLNEIDCFGNVTRVQIDTRGAGSQYDVYRKITQNTIENWVDSNRWLLNRLKEARVTSVIPTGQPFGTGENPLPVVTLTSPANGANFNAPATITLSANASDANGINRVEFYTGSTLLNTDVSAPYSYVWPNVPMGTYSLTAKAIDNAGGVSTSTPVTVTVNNVPPSVSLIAPPNGASYMLPYNVTLQANASDPNDGVNRVQFYVDGGHFATATAPPYTAVWGATAGTHSFVALAVDNAGAATWSNTVSATFNAPPLGISVPSSATGATGTPPTSTSVTVSVNAGGYGGLNFYWTQLDGDAMSVSGGQVATFTGWPRQPYDQCESPYPSIATFRVTVVDAGSQVATGDVVIYLYANQPQRFVGDCL